MSVMDKDFDGWNIKKKELDDNKQNLLFKEGEIWWCSIGQNVGEEVYGKGKDFWRPVVILRKVHQMRFISTNRLVDRQLSLLSSDFEELKKSVAALLGL